VLTHRLNRSVKALSELARQVNTRDHLMVRGKHRNISNRNQDFLGSAEPSSPTKANTGYPNTWEKQVVDLKSHFMMMIEDFKKDRNNSLKEIQDNTNKKIEVLKRKTQKSHKELQENTTKQMKELNKTIKDVRAGRETIKKSQRQTTLEIENLGKRTRVIDPSISNRIQEIEERLSGAEDTTEIMDTSIKDNVKHKKLLIKNIQEIQHTMIIKSNLRIKIIEQSKDSQI